MENLDASTDASIVISRDDLAELRVLQRTQAELNAVAVNVERQLNALNAQRSDIHKKLDMFDPQIISAMQRMQRKYGLPDTARINLETGAVE